MPSTSFSPICGCRTAPASRLRRRPRNALAARAPEREHPLFSRKNSRFSGKYRLKRVRFTCCSSASTWAKSVLTVKSATRLSVSPYFTSMPAVPSRSFENGLAPPRSVVRSAMAYGLSSKRRLSSGASIPTIAAASDRLRNGALTARGRNRIQERSLVLRLHVAHQVEAPDLIPAGPVAQRLEREGRLDRPAAVEAPGAQLPRSGSNPC